MQTSAAVVPKVHTVRLQGWVRALAIVVGVISIVAGLIVLIFPAIALLTLVLVLGIGLIFIGVERLAAGITGHGMTLQP
ncbi:MAG: DUF308 domain-containing protein [Thermoplasmata archaeon]